MVADEFGKQVKSLRSKAGLTQEELAHKSGVAIRFLQDIEAGNKQPSLTTIFKLADGLQVSISKLLDVPYKQWKQKASAGKK